MKRLPLFALLLLTAVIAHGQATPVPPIRYIGKRAADPATCSTALPTIYWNTASNVYKYCSAANTWTSLSGGGGSSGVTVGTTTSDGTSNVLLKTSSTGKVVDSTVTQNGSTITLGSAADATTTVTVTNANAPGNIFTTVNGTYIGHPTAIYFGDTDQFPLWGGISANGLSLGSLQDAGLAQVATSVVRPTNGANAATGWLQTAGDLRVTANVTNATTAFANVTGLSATLAAGRTYSFSGFLYVADSTAADGVKIDFNGGTATATDFRAHTLITDSALKTSTQTSAIATAVTAATITGDSLVEVSGTITVNAAGTFILRAAQNSHATGTLTVYRGSYLIVTDMP